MKRSYLELFFRHRWLILPVVMVPTIAVGVMLRQPRQYQSTLSIWNDSPSTMASTLEGGNAATPPSSTQQQVLQELLTTRRFLMAIARRTPLAHYVASAPPQKVNRVLAGLGASVTSSTPGPQLLTLTVTNSNPAMARDIASAVGAQLIAQEVTTLTNRDTATLNYELRQMNDIFAQLSDVTQPANFEVPFEISQLQGTNATSTNPLVQEYLADEQGYDEAEADEGTLTNSGVLSIFDPASLPQHVSRKKALILASVGGLLAGVSITILLLLLSMARDDTIWGPAELTTALGLKVVSSIERVGRRHRRALAGGAT